MDGRTRQARIKKWIKRQHEFDKAFNIDPRVTKMNIKMKLAGWDDIAGLDRKAIKSMGYKNDAKTKIKKYLPERDDYFVIWKKSKRVAW